MTTKHCPYITNCALFPHFKMRESLQIWKLTYCENEFARCERYQRAVTGRPTPASLLPNGRELTFSGKSGL